MSNLTKKASFRLSVKSRHPSHKPLRGALRLPFPCVVRFGSTTPSNVKVQINKPEAVETSKNKALMKKAFADANVKSPEFFLTFPEDPKYPLVAKLKFGSKGKGMKLLRTPEDEVPSGKGYYFEKYYSGSREYRLHVSDLGCFYSCRKMRKEEATDRWYFNSLNCVWILPDNILFDRPECWPQMVEECIKAKNAVGLDVCAVDVRVNSKGTDFRIIETNSAPSFGDITLERYLEHLPQLAQYVRTSVL